jgi:dTDP-4-amino-4,6-dideoxygalactose transaminase
LYSAQKPIPYGKHEITPGDIAAVVEVLQGDFLTQGPTIEKFEQALMAPSLCILRIKH